MLHLDEDERIDCPGRDESESSAFVPGMWPTGFLTFGGLGRRAMICAYYLAIAPAAIPSARSSACAREIPIRRLLDYCRNAPKVLNPTNGVMDKSTEPGRSV